MARENVLVVDDEQDILELVKYNLDKEGYRVTTVETGEDALSATRIKMPDLIVLDLMLPGVDGLKVLRLESEEARELYGADFALIHPDQIVAWRGSDANGAREAMGKLLG